MTSPPGFTNVFGEPGAARLIDLQRWQRMETGGGRLVVTETGLRLTTTDATAQRYSNAQIDDYQGRARRDFLWRPPLTLSLRARFSHPAMRAAPDRAVEDPALFGAQPGRAETRTGSGKTGAGPHPEKDAGLRPAEGAGVRPAESAGLRGTAGFGFWNDPFLMTGPRLPTLPRAIWFFYASPPSDIKLDRHTPGFGWKAATVDALHPSAALLTLTAPLVIPLMNIRAIYQSTWPALERVLRVSEARVEADITGWHTYVIEWGLRQARFIVDDTTVLDCDTPPHGPLGLVIWLDNQYLVATPWGRLRYGLLAVPGQQWMEVEWVEIVTQ